MPAAFSTVIIRWMLYFALASPDISNSNSSERTTTLAECLRSDGIRHEASSRLWANTLKLMAASMNKPAE
jgi:hypothetical protein